MYTGRFVSAGRVTLSRAMSAKFTSVFGDQDEHFLVNGSDKILEVNISVKEDAELQGTGAEC
jgi:hypothetical protein